MVFSLFRKKENKKTEEKYLKVRIKEIIKVASDAVNVVFDPLENEVNYRPGQFLTIIDEVKGVKLRRAYSLCSSPYLDKYPAITVKRVEKGQMSNHINDRYKEGQMIRIMEPIGIFTTDFSAENSRQIVLIGGGSGITPLYSLIKSLLHIESKSQIILIYGNKSMDHVIFKDDLNLLKDQYHNFNWINILEEDPDSHADHIGRPTVDMLTFILKGLAVSDKAEYFICGPKPMMEVVQTTLEISKVPKSQISIESFSAKQTASTDIVSEKVSVSILLEGTTHELKADSQKPILEQALMSDIDMPYYCKSGFCTACRGKVTEGQVSIEDAQGLSDDEIAEGYVLLCVGKALSSVVKIEMD